MRKLKALLRALVIVSIAIMPGVGACYTLGVALERLHGREEASQASAPETALVGTYAASGETRETREMPEGLVLRSRLVRNAQR
jgi:hypothetical protein